jgi:putative peptide zinc metalloprotease protein
MTAAAITVAGEPGVTVADRELLRSIEDHLVVDTSERDAVYLLVGRNGRHIRLSASAVQLLRNVARGVSFEQLADALSLRDARRVAAADVEASYRKLIAQIEQIEAQGDKLRGAFWLRRAILPGPFVHRIAGACAAAFHPLAVVGFLAAVVALTIMLGGSALDQRSGLSVEAGQFWPAYGLFLASLVMHEIGHASACARYGARPSEIGVALYVIYPVFYSNVSAAWTLKRWQRVIVDIGGVYFQLVVGAAYTFAYAVSDWEPLRVAVLFILGSCVFSLNPILKFDGYWVVADALGVTNLQRQPARILRYLAARLRGRPAPALPWRPFVTVMLALYSLLSIGFWVWFLWEITPALVPHAIHAGRVITSLIADLISSPVWPDGARLKEGVAAAYVLLLAALMGWRLLRALIRIMPAATPVDRLPEASPTSAKLN